MEADINLAILEEEHLIGRLKTIELLERQSPYRGSPERVDQRFAHALAAVPTELQTAALATFASVRYLGQPVLADAWRFLWSSLDLVGRGIADLNEVVFLELDRDQIRDDFFRANSLAGRLQDNYPWRSGHDIVDTLAPLTDGALLGPLRDAMVEYLGRRLWVLLVDVSVSGTSVVSELARLSALRQEFFPHPRGQLLALAQVATADALHAAAEAGHELRAAIHVPREWALGDPAYSLVVDPALVEDMRALCKWFAESHVSGSGYRLERLAQEAPQVAYYGFGERGWSVVLHRNTPNNSLPILWFAPPSRSYTPPFERIDSRTGASWDGRRKWFETLDSDPDMADTIRSRLAPPAAEIL